MEPSDSPNTVPAPKRFATPNSDNWNEKIRQTLLQVKLWRPEWKNLSFAVCGETAVLRGQVKTWLEKEQCIAFALSVGGVWRVVDELWVAE